MNNVMNRKMFRPRNARNKLNAMGGIMASSAPLMQTVQKFSEGGASSINKYGQIMQPGGYGVRSSYPYQPVTAPLNNPNLQRVIANNEAARRALRSGEVQDMPATGLMSTDMARLRAAEARGPRSNFMDFLNRVGEDAKTLFTGTNQEIVDATRRKFLGVQPKVREGIQTLTEDAPMTTQTNTSLAAAENLSAPTYTVDDIVYQSGDTQAAFSDDAGLERNAGMIAERDILDESPASLNDVKAEPLPSFLRTDKGGTKADELKSTNIAESLLSARVSEEKPTKEAPKEKKGVTEQVSPAAVEIVTKTAKIDTKDAPKTQSIIKEIGATIQKQLDAGQFDEAEEGIAKATGIEERAENESSTRKEKIEKERALIAEFLGVDPNQYKQERGLALANAAFNYMQNGNLGQAGQIFTEQNRQILAAQRKEKEAISAMAYKAVTGREETQADRDFRSKEAKYNRNHDFRLLGQKEAGAQRRLLTDMSFRAALNDSNNMLKIKMKNTDLDALDTRLNSEMLMLNTRLQNATDIANAGNLSAEAIAGANRDAADARAMISGMGDGIRLAMLENSQKEEPLTGPELTDFLSSRSKELALKVDKFGPGTFARVVTENAGILLQNDMASSPEEAFSLIIEGIRGNAPLAAEYAADLAGFPVAPENDPTVAQLTKDPATLSPTELKNLWDAGKRTITFGNKIYPLNPDE